MAGSNWNRRGRSLLGVLPLILSSFSLGVVGAADGTDIRDGGMNFDRLAALRSVADVAISPDGAHVAYVLNVPRRPGRDEDGRAYRELHVLSTLDGTSRPFIAGDVSIRGIRFTPDGRFVTYLAHRDGAAKVALWGIPIAGGESRLLCEHDEPIESYRISPDGRRVAFLAREARGEADENAREKGYGQEIFEEDWRTRRVWIAGIDFDPAPVPDPSLEPADEDDESGSAAPLDLVGSAFEVEWMPDGTALLLTLAPTPLIDDRYMARRLHVVTVADGAVRTRIENPGKLGEFAVSPDGKTVALVSAADPHDPKEGRLLVAALDRADQPLTDLLPDLVGHVRSIAWRDHETLVYVADLGVEAMLGEIRVDGTKPKTRLVSDGSRGLPLLSRVRASADGRGLALIGEAPTHPSEVFTLGRGSDTPRRRTRVNPWLDDVRLARQEIVRWEARDGLSLEGVLLRPLDTPSEAPAPLLLMVHGGPESHSRNGWLTTYSRPGQLAAAAGFLVLYPNYRGSTGRGVDFAKLSQGDAAGREFDDLIDAVDALVAGGLADGDRVGINGNSYGGYATAWCSTRHTERFRAGVMMVGISNKLSKAFTTEIPVEDLMVHTRFEPWTRWEFSLERSPILYAAQSRTALLIATGTADTRVHPSQSLQLYRALKQIGKTPVRLVRYPGEGHGNQRAASRDDFSRRLLRWMEWFVRDSNSDLPPWELEIPALAEEPEDD